MAGAADAAAGGRGDDRPAEGRAAAGWPPVVRRMSVGNQIRAPALEFVTPWFGLPKMRHVSDGPMPIWSEFDRLAVLESYHVVDTPSERALDDLARLAAAVCGAPAAAISFVAADRLWLKAAVGIALADAPRQSSFCDSALRGAGLLVVADARADQRFTAMPLVPGGPPVRFYAGAPLTTAEGLPLGTLCVFDTTPRPGGLDEQQGFALEALARQVMAQLELRRVREARARSEERLSLTVDIAGAVGAWTWDGVTDRIYADGVFAEIFGLPEAAATEGVPTRAVIAAIHPADRNRIRLALTAAAAQAGDVAEECRVVRPDGGVRWVFARAHCFHEAGQPARYPGVVIDISERKAVAERLRITEETARLALEAGRIGTYDFVPATGALTWDARCKELFGLPADAAVDYAVFLAGLHPDDREEAEAAVGAALDPGGNGEFDIEYRTIGLTDGVERWIAAKGRTFRQLDGQVRFIGTVRDVTQRRHAEDAMRGAEASVRVALAAAELGRFDHDPSTGRRFWDARCREIFGIGAGEPDIAFDAVIAAIHPDDVAAVLAAVDRVTSPDGGGRLEIQFRATRLSDGEERWISATGATFFRDGVCTRFLGVVADVTEAKRHEQHLRLLVNELNHRVKNSFAMVQALASQSFREIGLPAEAMQAFSGRLIALAKAHDALTRRNWEGADLHEVLEPTIATHGGVEGGRFDISGPRVRLSAKLALSISMALHELSTNALKYGALANDRGIVRVSWDVDAMSQPPRLRLCWRESGGPPVVEPTRRGFGSRLLERGLAAELGGAVILAYEPEGLACTMDVPLAEAPLEKE